MLVRRHYRLILPLNNGKACLNIEGNVIPRLVTIEVVVKVTVDIRPDTSGVGFVVDASVLPPQSALVARPISR